MLLSLHKDLCQKHIYSPKSPQLCFIIYQVCNILKLMLDQTFSTLASIKMNFTLIFKQMVFVWQNMKWQNSVDWRGQDFERS